jgi:hypothetical protein
MAYTIDTIASLLRQYIPVGVQLESKNNEDGVGALSPVDGQRGFVDYLTANQADLWSGFHREMFSVILQADTIAKVTVLLGLLKTLSQQYRTGVAGAGTLNNQISATTTAIRIIPNWVNKGADLFETGISPWIVTSPPPTITIENVGGINCLRFTSTPGIIASASRLIEVSTLGTFEFWYRSDSIVMTNCLIRFNFISTLGIVFWIEFAPGWQMQWEAGANSPYLTGVWYKVKTIYNNTTHTYDAYFNDVLQAAGLPYMCAGTPVRLDVACDASDAGTVASVKYPAIQGNSRNERMYAKILVDRRIPATTWTITAATLTIPVTGDIGGTYVIRGLKGSNISFATLASIAALVPTTASATSVFIVGNNAVNVLTIIQELVATGQLDTATPTTGFVIELQTAGAENAVIGTPTLVITVAAAVDNIYPYQLDLGAATLTYDGTYWNIAFTVDGYWKLA